MKKLLILIIPLLGMLLYTQSGLIFFTMQSDGYSVYGEKFPTEEYNLSASEAYFICLSSREKGVSVRLQNGDYDSLINNLLAREKFSEKYDDAVLLYYSSPFLKNYVRLKGEKINLQIAVLADGTVIAGTPVILGSY